MNNIQFRFFTMMCAIAVCILGLSFPSPGKAAEAQPEVLKAIALLRQISTPTTPKAVRDLHKNPELRKAWDAIADSGASGLEALKTALADAKAAESVFIVVGGALLWRLDGLDKADDIAALWTKHTFPAGLGSPMLHATAYAAARTRDARALLIIFAVFRDTDAVIDFPRAGISLAWQETLDFIWDAYGPQGCEALAKAFAESQDRDFQASAAFSPRRHQPTSRIFWRRGR